MARRSDIPWPEIEEVFKTTSKTATELARDFGLPPSTVTRKAARSGWWEGRKEALLSAAGGHCDRTSGFIYVASVTVGHARNYKIGKAARVDERIRAHQVSCPLEVRLEVSYYAKDMHAEEKLLHLMFSDQRVRGEWFTLSPADLSFIAGRCAQAAGV